jgi:hypothetical protein
MSQKVSEEEFIKLWRELQSPKLVAQALGINERNVHTRRRAIEKRRDMILTASHFMSPTQTQNFDYDRGVINYKIDNGMVFIFSDAHYWPDYISTAHRGLVHLIKKFRQHTKAVICNGDAFDGASISRFPSLGWEHKPTVKQELEAVSDRLDEIVKAAPAAKHFWPCGNHDARFETRIANSLPEMREVGGMHLKDHIPKWVPCWRVDINDDIVVRHREAGGEHADWNNVVKSGGKTVITGHDHRIGVVPYESYGGLSYGVRTGMLADSALDGQFRNYLEAKAPNWHSGFVVLTFSDGQLLMPEIARKWCDGVIEFRGELIDV